LHLAVQLFVLMPLARQRFFHGFRLKAVVTCLTIRPFERRSATIGNRASGFINFLGRFFRQKIGGQDADAQNR
jgi:hypothetical protein